MREFIDKAHLLTEIKRLQKSPWYNRGKDDMVVARAFYNERKEAVEVVRDLCVNDEPVITEQDIVKPIIKEFREKLTKWMFHNSEPVCGDSMIDIDYLEGHIDEILYEMGIYGEVEDGKA